MAKRKNPGRQASYIPHRGVQPTVVVQDDGRTLVTVDISRADLPELSFYANALMSKRFGPVVSYFFGQAAQAVQEQPVSSIVRIDVPIAALGEIIKSFAPIRDLLTRVDSSMDAVAAVSGVAKTAFAYSAHAVGLLVNDHMTVMDFYQLVPVRGGLFEVMPVIRMTGVPQLATAFVAQSDLFSGG